jgi:hypothetical protein
MAKCTSELENLRVQKEGYVKKVDKKEINRKIKNVTEHVYKQFVEPVDPYILHLYI